MKNFRKVVLVSTVLSSFLMAGDDIMIKVTNFYNTLTNHAFNFKAIKSGDGYDLHIEPNNYAYKEIFNPDAKIHISVDEGPTVTKPKFTFAKAGLVAESEIISIFNKQIQDDIKKDLKNPPKLKYSAILGFGDNLKENITIEPFVVDSKDMKVDSSKVEITTDIDLSKFVGDMNLKYDHFIMQPKDEPGIFKISNVEAKSKIVEPPVEGFFLFSESSLNVGNIEMSASKPQKVKFKFSLNAASGAKKVSDILSDITMLMDVKTNDIDTIALAKGVKESKNKFEFKNIGTQGLVELIKLTKKMEEAQNEMALASKSKNDEKALAKYLATMDEINNKLVPIFNSTFIKDKSKIIADLELFSNKVSYIKLDLTYKAEPISGSLNSAFISLAAQGLAIVDGDIDVKVDKDLATTINPFALIVLDMLKVKGLASEKNGIYELKATLKGGNVIINGKSYTLQELTRVLF